MHRRRFLCHSLGIATGVAGATTRPRRVASSGGGAPRTLPSTADTTTYQPLGSVDVPGAREAVVHPERSAAYVATMDGFVEVDVGDPTTPAVVAERRDIETDAGRLGGIWDLSVDGERLAVVGPAHHDGRPRGVALFDVSTPGDPAQVAFHPTEFHIHNACLADGVVYLTGSGLPETPLVMVDASDDDPVEVGRWSPVDEDSDWREVPSQLRVLHDVFVRGDLAVLSCWDAGTWLVDVSQLARPEVRARVGDHGLTDLRSLSTAEAGVEAIIPPGNAHSARLNGDGTLLAVGTEAWATVDSAGAMGEAGELVGGPGGIDLWDVTDPADPTHHSHVPAPPSADQTTSGRFTTAHNFDLVGDRLLSSWYYGGVAVHDVSDPADPVELARWHDPATASFWTAQSLTAGETFVASSASLTDFDASLPATREALYVFPERAGTQSDPPSLTGDGTAVGPPSGRRAGNADGDADGSGPGLGIGAALAGLAGLGGLATRGRTRPTGTGPDDGPAAGDLSHSEGE